MLVTTAAAKLFSRDLWIHFFPALCSFFWFSFYSQRPWTLNGLDFGEGGDF
jgi:hypothetical protein